MPQVNTAAKQNAAKDRATTRTLLPLVALGGGLAAAPAGALELGDLTVQSHLGQPLRASIAYALAPNEMLSDTCVSIGGGRSTSGLPGIGRGTVSITETAIVITGQSVVREPMLGTRVTINCPYTPNLSREYMLFVDPATIADATAPQSGAAPLPVARPEPEPVAQPTAATPTARTAPVNNTPIGQSTRYQVQPGDTLGDIVRRIENRSMSLWPAVNMVFAANPDAFLDNDPNRLKAGSWLTIPSLDGTAPVVAATTTVADTPEAPAEEASATETLAAGEIADAMKEAAGSVYDGAADESLGEVPEEEAAVTDSTADLRPGDVVMSSTAVAAGETVAIPDTELEGPQTTSSSPNVPTAVISTGARSESTSLLAWLIGGGLAIIIALVLFGRRFRSRFGSTPVGPALDRRNTDEPNQADIFAEDDYDIDDDSPTAENLALDADLITGSGLDEGVDMDVAQDFGFAATTDLDIELPFEPEPEARGDTDIIPPVTRDIESILESEVLPEDDDYDMSVIMDATKMPQPEDVTERDLKAVEVGSNDETLIANNYTISKELDYDILEQDYEDELTATQALNLEIERAATELAEDLDEATAEIDAAAAETDVDEETTEMPLATVTELDVTAQLPAKDDDELTAEMEARPDPNDTAAVTVNMSAADDETAEMPVANDDETAEMEIEGGTINTKQG